MNFWSSEVRNGSGSPVTLRLKLFEARAATAGEGGKEFCDMSAGAFVTGSRLALELVTDEPEPEHPESVMAIKGRIQNPVAINQKSGRVFEGSIPICQSTGMTWPSA